LDLQSGSPVQRRRSSENGTQMSRRSFSVYCYPIWVNQCASQLLVVDEQCFTWTAWCLRVVLYRRHSYLFTYLEQHIILVEKVLKLSAKYNLFVKLKKCELFQDNVTFLCYKLSAAGLSVEQDNVKAIMEWHTPKNVEQVQSYLGTVGCYRKFIKNFAKKSTHLFV